MTKDARSVTPEDVAAARLPWLSPRVTGWYDAARLRRQVAGGLADELGRVGDVGFGAAFRDGVALPPPAPTDPAAWANRVLDLPGGGWALTGIRFRGRDLALPFVEVVATTETATPDGLAVVAEAVGRAYEGFGPLCLRVDAGNPAALADALAADCRFGPGCFSDQLVVAGRVADLRVRPRALSYPLVRLVPGDPGELAQHAARTYAAIPEPAQAAWAGPEDEESLAECAAQGLLFEVRASGSRCGVVAARREGGHAMTGFVVAEVVLDAAHRGQGLAAGVLQRLADTLPAGDGDVLWGTIHPGNLRSLRNALRVGREVVGGYLWVTPRGWPGMSARVLGKPGSGR